MDSKWWRTGANTNAHSHNYAQRNTAPYANSQGAPYTANSPKYFSASIR